MLDVMQRSAPNIQINNTKQAHQTESKSKCDNNKIQQQTLYTQDFFPLLLVLAK